jgi:hypothetical protein
MNRIAPSVRKKDLNYSERTVVPLLGKPRLWLGHIVHDRRRRVGAAWLRARRSSMAR